MARFSLFFEGIKLRTPRQLPEKLGAPLIVKGECGAETIADYNRNSKTMEYIPLNIFP